MSQEAISGKKGGYLTCAYCLIKNYCRCWNECENAFVIVNLPLARFSFLQLHFKSFLKHPDIRHKKFLFLQQFHE
jgi:hypothetical protein